jgi:hypothetical protein
MEVYIGPPDTALGAHLSREQVLGALADAALVIETADETLDTGSGKARWILSFQANDARLTFQVTVTGLVFATLDHSAFDNSTYPDRICRALETLGWQVDSSNVG